MCGFSSRLPKAASLALHCSAPLPCSGKGGSSESVSGGEIIIVYDCIHYGEWSPGSFASFVP